jgi:hypothetical protein
MAELRAIALVISSRATSSWTMAWRAGASKAFATPKPNERRRMCQGWITWRNVSPAVRKARSIIATWVMTMILRRDMRSATTPA